MHKNFRGIVYNVSLPTSDQYHRMRHEYGLLGTSSLDDSTAGYYAQRKYDVLRVLKTPFRFIVLDKKFVANANINSTVNSHGRSEVGFHTALHRGHHRLLLDSSARTQS